MKFFLHRNGDNFKLNRFVEAASFKEAQEKWKTIKELYGINNYHLEDTSNSPTDV